MDAAPTLDATAALTRLGGLASTAELRGLISKRELARAVGAGDLVRLRTGRYAAASVSDTAAAAERVGGVQSHLSAALSWGWKVKTVPQAPMVTVPRGRQLSASRRQGVAVRWADLLPGDVVDGVTSRVLTAVACARDLPFDEALCVVDSALREGLVTKRQLLEAARRGPRTGRARAVRVIELGDGRAANPFESALRAIATTVPGLEVGAQGWVGNHRADLTDPVLKVVVEAESWEYHGDRGPFDADVRRYTTMIRLGWLVARFLWEDVMHRPDQVRAVLLDLVELRTEPRQFVRRGAA